jgi:hypothetical protein
VAQEELLDFRIGENGFLVHLAGPAPFGGEIQEDGVAGRDRTPYSERNLPSYLLISISPNLPTPHVASRRLFERYTR